MLKAQGNRIRTYTAIAVAMWTVFVGLLFLWGVAQIQNVARELATKEAVAPP